MRINLYNAGKSVSYQLGNGGSLPSEGVEGGVHYAHHLVDRHVVLPFIYDATLQSFQNVLNQYDREILVDGDSAATHWLYAGTKVYDIVFNIKQPTAGVTLTAQLRKASDGSAIGDPLTVDMSTTGYVQLAPTAPVFLSEDTYLDVAIAGGNLHTSCFSIMVELVYFNDQHKCACVRVPCEVEFPEPMCS